MTITWRRLAVADFPLLRGWLEQPHVRRWWNHETSPEAVERDFGPAARGEEPSEDFLVFLDEEPVGLVQRVSFADYPDYAEELRTLVEVPDGAVTVDYLVGDQARAGQGIGPRMIAAVVEATWTDHPGAPCVVVPVAAGNRASWRALEKAGLHRVGEGELTPDNPAEGRDHVVYRADRPRSSHS
ncbi:GNAT family N-acetyltransferase [Nonomuraea longicatena]|uniref:N-acetyltransferase domain-containing protein n=1 Tax=Nonomuraea longicatena TaxID=83682 RepID=A0ABN1Q5U7_9ACTN